LNSEYKSIFKFVTKRDNLFNSYNIVKMWINPDGNNTEKLISEVDSIAEFLLDSILKNSTTLRSYMMELVFKLHNNPLVFSVILKHLIL